MQGMAYVLDIIGLELAETKRRLAIAEQALRDRDELVEVLQTQIAEEDANNAGGSTARTSAGSRS